MSEIKKGVCKIIPDSVTVQSPFLSATWNVRQRLGCPTNEPKEKCYQLTDKVTVCVANDDA